jgi:malonyl-CoA O-methyltransferase
MPEPSDLDRLAVRRQFDRRAESAGRADFLLREVERRMIERLDLVRLTPSRVLDIGCGLGDGVRRLRVRWPQAEVIGLDLSPRRIDQAIRLDRPARQSWTQALLQRFGSRAQRETAAAPAAGSPAGVPAPSAPLGRYLVADAHQLPFQASSVDLLWSNLAFHWFDDVPAAIDQWYRVIRPDGLLMFSALGVDTLHELRQTGLAMQSLPDLHDIGDALVQAGFAEPVMDAQRLTVTWTDPATMLAELRGLGGDARRGRARGLMTPRRRDAALKAAAARLRAQDPLGPLSITFEIIYGHAWCGPSKRLPDGYSPIEFRASPGSAKR